MARIATLIRQAAAHAGFRRYLKSTSWFLGGRIITMLISFLATLYIARNLGPTNYGQLSYAVSVIGVIGFIAPLGLDTIVYRELIKTPERKGSLLGTALILKLIAGALTAVVAIILAYTLSADDVSRILIFILAGTFVIAPFQIASFEFLARSKSNYQALVSIGVTILLNIAKIVIIASGKGVIYIALTLLAEPLLYAIAYLFIYARTASHRLRTWTWERGVAFSLLRDSLPFALLSSFTFIYARIDQVLIKQLLGATEVGLYDAAVRLVDVWNFIPGAITSGLFPALVHAHTTSPSALNRRTWRMSWLFVVIPLLICSTIYAVAPVLIRELYGPAFAGSIPVLQIYIWSYIGTSLGILVQTYLTVTNERALIAASAFVPMLINIGLNILWIPRFGMVGAAYATLISYSLVPFFILFRKRSAP
jgi:O-antigen/teichoic acid export membrane protein